MCPHFAPPDLGETNVCYRPLLITISIPSGIVIGFSSRIRCTCQYDGDGVTPLSFGKVQGE